MPIALPDKSFASTMQLLGTVQLALFGCIWAGFGIVSFFLIQYWGQEVDRKMALIAEGKAQPRTLYVVSIKYVASVPARHHSDDDWHIGLSLRQDEANPQKVEDYEHTQDPAGLEVGNKITGYFIEGNWFVPRFITGGFGWGKWVFLAFGLVPPMTVAAIMMAVRRHRRKKAAAAAA